MTNVQQPYPPNYALPPEMVDFWAAGKNYLFNGGFEGNLYYWAGTGVINRTLGYPRLGCCQLDTGRYIEQVRAIGPNWPHTIHFYYRLSTGATLTVQYGATISQTFSGTPADVWREGVLTFAVDASPAATDSVKFTASGGTVYVDTATLMVNSPAMTRAALASAIQGRITALVSDSGFDATASALGPEGDYTSAVEEAFRSLGAINRWGDADPPTLPTDKINDLVVAGQEAMIHKLRAKYALKTDVSLGPRRESYSQIAQSLDEMLAGNASDHRVSTGPITYGDWQR